MINAYIEPRSYLVTICTKERRCLFVEADLVNLLIVLLGEVAREHLFDLYAYCFMPDHCHFVICGLDPYCDLISTVRSFKDKAAVLFRRRGLQGAWQKGFHDHIIRDDEDLRNCANYVLENPVRAGLVSEKHERQFSGSRVFRWPPFAGGVKPPLQCPSLRTRMPHQRFRHMRGLRR